MNVMNVIDKLTIYGEIIIKMVSDETKKENDVKNILRLYFLQLINLTILDINFHEMKIQLKKRKISVSKYISIVDESINKFIYLFLGLEKDYSGIYMDADITIDISNRLKLIPEYENGLIFLQYLNDDIDPLQVYIRILQEIEIESKIIPIVSKCSERIYATITYLHEINKPCNKAIFYSIHGFYI